MRNTGLRLTYVGSALVLVSVGVALYSPTDRSALWFVGAILGTACAALGLLWLLVAGIRMVPNRHLQESRRIGIRLIAQGSALAVATVLLLSRDADCWANMDVCDLVTVLWIISGILGIGCLSLGFVGLLVGWLRGRVVTGQTK